MYKYERAMSKCGGGNMYHAQLLVTRLLLEWVGMLVTVRLLLVAAEGS